MDDINLLNRFANEVVANALDQMELFGCNEKICQAVRRGIYGRRDAFILKIKTGMECDNDKTVK